MTTNKTRLNTDIRKKIGGLILSHFENEKTTELENFKSAKEDITTAYNTAFKIASNVVGRAYPKNDVATLQAFKKKYGSAVDVVAKDSCFHFANTEIETTENERDNNEHFDFKLDANMSGRFSNSDFGIAYFRDDLKSAGLNPEINVQHQDNRSNPHHTQELDKIKKFLGYSNEDGIYQSWKDKYSLDVIGTSYCRSRTIPCTAKEFDQMRAFKNARQSFVQSHYTWAEMIQKDMRDITNALKDYKYCLGFDNQDFIKDFFGTQLSDTLLSWTVPIFWCGTDLSRYLPEGSYIQFNAREESEIDRIIEIIKN